MSNFVEVELELEEEVVEFIKKTAEEEGLTQNEFINKILIAFLENHCEGNK